MSNYTIYHLCKVGTVSEVLCGDMKVWIPDVEGLFAIYSEKDAKEINFGSRPDDCQNCYRIWKHI